MRYLLGCIVTIVILIGTLSFFVKVPYVDKLIVFSRFHLLNKIDTKKFDNLYSALKNIEGAVAVGVNYIKYGELLQKVSAEIIIAKDKLKNDNEIKLHASFNDAFVAYNDSFIIWQSSISQSSSQVKELQKGMIIVTSETEPIVSRYSLKSEPFLWKFYNRNFDTISSEGSMQIIWRRASDIIHTANEIYKP